MIEYKKKYINHSFAILFEPCKKNIHIDVINEKLKHSG